MGNNYLMGTVIFFFFEGGDESDPNQIVVLVIQPWECTKSYWIKIVTVVNFIIKIYKVVILGDIQDPL